jgi:hypothetical protein
MKAEGASWVNIALIQHTQKAPAKIEQPAGTRVYGAPCAAPPLADSEYTLPLPVGNLFNSILLPRAVGAILPVAA